ncbi:nucleotidyltransferase domain-containing protein [Streptomyces sp. URMC 126]|uniref:nucleotidyltransferase domain-containing protein n=1 Tax=Streptomyces sp. URMC 126 TaxID=3423401 RepID=UPI003F199907
MAEKPPPPGGIPIAESEAAARWTRAWRPERVAERLAGTGMPWYVAGGWALDLFRGEPSRVHGDVEIAVPAAAFPEIRDRFPGYVFDAVGAGRLWPAAGPEALAATHQTWLRDPETGRFHLDVFREPHDGDTWICRRDEGLRLPYAAVIERSAGGIPYLRPELVLLFKAKGARPKDRADFAATLPLLDRARRDALGRWLERVHPGHPWLDATAAPPAL